MQSTDGREKLAENPSVGEMQPVRLTGRRPTLDRIRVEAEEAALRKKRRKMIVRVASVLVVVSLAALAYGLLAP
jgi:hypothetical protein